MELNRIAAASVVILLSALPAKAQQTLTEAQLQALQQAQSQLQQQLRQMQNETSLQQGQQTLQRDQNLGNLIQIPQDKDTVRQLEEDLARSKRSP